MVLSSGIKKIILILFITLFALGKIRSQCNTNTSVCSLGTGGPYNFVPAGTTVSTCLNFNGNIGYIMLYITQSGSLNMLIDGNANTGYLDVAVFNIPAGQSPCVAIENDANEISCNYAPLGSGSVGCSQFGSAFGCASSVPAPSVTAGQVLMIVVDNWSMASTNFTLQLATTPGSAQTGPPSAAINPVAAVCSNAAPFQLTATNNGGTWSGPGTSASGMFNPATAGPGTHTINYSIGTAPCNASSSTTIQVLPSPTVTITSSATGVCSGGSATLTSNVSPAGGTYSWLAGGATTPGITVSPTTATTYTCNYTQGGCTTSATASLSVNALPTVDAGNPQTICPGQSVNLTGTASVVQPSSLTFNSTGAATIPDNGTVNNNITVSGLPYSTITTTSISRVCINISHTWDSDLDIFLRCPSGTLLELSTDNGGTGDHYTNTCFVPAPATNITAGSPPFTGNFLPEGAGGLGALSGCTANGTWTLVVTDDAAIIAGTLNSWNITFAIPAPTLTYSWAPAAGMTGSTTLTPTVSPTATTQYTLTANNSGCIKTDSVTINVNSATPITITSPAPICSGASATLTAMPLIAGAVYTWTPGGTTGQSITVSPTSTTVYSCSYTLGSCTSLPATGTVTVINASSVSVNSPSICVGNSATLTATSPATTYTWSPATGLSATTGTSVTANPTITTVYTITETSSGCNGTTTATVTVNNLPSVDAGINDTICDGSSSTLTAFGGTSYAWSADPTLSTLTAASTVATPNVTTTYTVTGTDGNNCSAVDSVTVVVYPIPVAPTFTVPAFICPGDPVTLTASPIVAGATCTWQPGNLTGQSVVVSPTVTTVYSCTYEVNGCTSSATSGTVTVNNAAAINVPSVAICIGNDTTLNASGASGYTWSPSTGLSATTGASVTANPTITTVYTITETTSGCNGTTTATVTVNALPPVDAGV
ncbi:MAG TPA: proprotein convertase P-domain-containing protein, partial [Bacteroidia bacterium]